MNTSSNALALRDGFLFFHNVDFDVLFDCEEGLQSLYVIFHKLRDLLRGVHVGSGALDVQEIEIDAARSKNGRRLDEPNLVPVDLDIVVIKSVEFFNIVGADKVLAIELATGCMGMRIALGRHALTLQEIDETSCRRRHSTPMYVDLT